MITLAHEQVSRAIVEQLGMNQKSDLGYEFNNTRKTLQRDKARVSGESAVYVCRSLCYVIKMIISDKILQI